MRILTRGATRLLLATLAWGPIAWGAIACARPPATDGGQAGRNAVRSRSDLLTEQEIARAQHGNAFDLIQATRPRWLITRGSDTIHGEPTQVQVLLDGVPIGDLRSLYNINTMGIKFIQFIDGTTASSRWGLGYGQGAIYISTRP